MCFKRHIHILIKCCTDVADCYIKISSCLVQLSTFDHRELDWFLNRFSETLEKLRVSIAIYIIQCI